MNFLLKTRKYKFVTKISLGFFVFVFLSAPFSVKAQQTSGSLGGNGGFGADIGGIVGVGASCALGNLGGVGGLQEMIKDLFGGKKKKEEKPPKDFNNVSQSGGAISTTVPVTDSGAIGAVTKFDTTSNEKLERVKKEEISDTIKETCLDKIVKYAATKVLDKITLATVDWINNGFEGQPFYLENTGAFFEEIATEEINLVTGRFTDPTANLNYPFGRIVMESILSGLQRDFYQESVFSLNEVLAHGTYEEFSVDFNVGGWAGYVGMLEPANNPFAQYMEMSNFLSRKVQGTSINASIDFQAQLSQSGGFLNQRECVLTATGDPSDDYIPENDPYHISPGGPVPDALADMVVNMPDDQMLATIRYYEARSVCRQWRNLTPGGIISNEIKEAIQIPQEQLLIADELNEDIGLILDALLTQLITEGLSALQSADNGGNSTNNVLLAQIEGLQPGQIANNYIPPSPVETILGGGNQVNIALVDVQNQYIALATAPGTGAVALLNEAIAKTRSLDYCVPGPNPNWISSAEQNLLDTLSAITPFVSIAADPGVAQDENEDYYSTQIFNLTGVGIVESPAMDSYVEFIAFMENAFNLYKERMQDTTNGGYSLNGIPPTQRPILSGLLANEVTYNEELDFINNYLNNITNYIALLGQIQGTLQAIAANNNGVVDPNNPAVQAQISVYNTIASNFVTEDQLQALIDRIEDYDAQINLLENYLNSCINETVNLPYPYPDQRVSYPPPIFPYTQTVAPFTSMPDPNPDQTFLPGVDFGTDQGDINIEFANVQIDSPSNGLGVFEAVLETVY